jgi:hypothetical protein
MLVLPVIFHAKRLRQDAPPPKETQSARSEEVLLKSNQPHPDALDAAKGIEGRRMLELLQTSKACQPHFKRANNCNY